MRWGTVGTLLALSHTHASIFWLPTHHWSFDGNPGPMKEGVGVSSCEMEGLVGGIAVQHSISRLYRGSYQ